MGVFDEQEAGCEQEQAEEIEIPQAEESLELVEDGHRQRERCVEPRSRVWELELEKEAVGHGRSGVGYRARVSRKGFRCKESWKWPASPIS